MFRACHSPSFTPLWVWKYLETEWGVGCGLGAAAPDRLVHRPPTALPHAPVPCVSRNAQGNAAETACSKSALLEISLQSQALLHPRAGERQLHQGRSKSASRNPDKMWMTTAVSHVIVFCCSWLLGILDSMPETCMLHRKWQPVFFVALLLRA